MEHVDDLLKLRALPQRLNGKSEGSRRFESAVVRHRVLISQYRALELPNNARQRRLSHVGGSGENQFPEGDGQLAAKISVGKLGATVWVGSDRASSLIGKSGATIRSGQGLRES